MKKYRIVWSKWVNPLQRDANSSNDDIDNDDSDEWNESVEDRATIVQLMREEIGVPKVVMTEGGMFEFVIRNDPEKLFNLWEGNTYGFPVSRKVKQLIGQIDGVEAIDVYSPYMFRVAVGKLYKPSDVCSRITHKLEEYLQQKQKSKQC